jgi:hypothetical protein
MRREPEFPEPAVPELNFNNPEAPLDPEFLD